MFECPRKSLDFNVMRYIEYYSYYKKNWLPNEGGVSKQPIKIMEIFKVIETAVEKFSPKETIPNG